MTFIPKRPNRSMTYPLFHLNRGLKEQTGDIGIEVEVEGNRFPKHEYEGHSAVDPEKIPKVWVYHKDGSLRGADNAEYVLKKPIKFADVPKTVGDLWQMFSDYGTVLDDSNRTSVHVHLNVQKWFLPRLCTFLGMYFSVEEILTQWAGEHRVGNLFCLRAKDAPGIITDIKEFLKQGGTRSFGSGMHYAGLNVSSLGRFGSVEIRALRGATEAQTIIDWVNVLQRLYELSGEFTDPRNLVSGFSGEGAMGYFQRVFGEYSNLVREGSGMTTSQITESLYEGIRFAQDLCYCREWAELELVDPADDPFNRSPTGRKKSFSPSPLVMDWAVAAPSPAPSLTISNSAAFDTYYASVMNPPPVTFEPEEEPDHSDDYEEPEEDYYDDDEV